MKSQCPDRNPRHSWRGGCQFAGLHCGRPLEYLAIKAGAANWVPSRLEHRDVAQDDTTTTNGWYIVGLAAPIEGRAVRFRM